MPTGPQRRHRALAAVVTVAGVLGIWAWSTVRQGRQTETLSRRWVGEQWDVARDCFVGSPIGRGEGTEAIATKLQARALEALLAASTAEQAPSRAALWPARCVPALRDLKVDPRILRADPSAAIATLEVLSARVLAADAPVLPAGPLADEPTPEPVAADVLRRAAELAEPIAVLDEAMPSGAEYDVGRHSAAPPSVDPSLVARSLACEGDAARALAAPRPFLEAAAGPDGVRVHDLRLAAAGTERLVEGGEGAVRWLRAATDGASGSALTVAGATHPRFFGADAVAWLAEQGSALWLTDRAGEVTSRAPLPLETPVGSLAVCGAGEGGTLALASGDAIVLARAPHGRPSGEVAALRPAPPRQGVLWACGDRLAVVLWRQGQRWVGSACAWSALSSEPGAAEGAATDPEARCRPVPPLSAGPGLQLAVRGSRALALGRGRRTDLPLAWPLLVEPNGSRWGEPVAAIRGWLEVAPGSFSISACGVEVRSEAGRRWERPVGS